MQFRFSTEENARRISTTEEAIEYVAAVDEFVEHISGEQASDELKAATRDAVLIYSSQQTANGLAYRYNSEQTAIRAELGIEGFSVTPTFSEYRFEPVLDERGEIISGQFKVTADLRMSTTRIISSGETQINQADFARTAILAEGLEILGIGEVIGSDIHGSFIATVTEDRAVSTRDVEARFVLVAPPVTDAVRAQKVIDEVLDASKRKAIEEETQDCEEAIRDQLEFSPGAIEKRLKGSSITEQTLRPSLEDLGEIQEIIAAPYTNRVNMALGSIGEDTFKTHVTHVQSERIPIGEEQFQVTTKATYVTEKRLDINPSTADRQRVEDARSILGVGVAAVAEVGASFIVERGEIHDFETTCFARVGGALDIDEFVDIEEELAHARTLIQETLEYDRAEKGAEASLTIEGIQTATTMYKGALQKTLDLSRGNQKVLQKISPDEESLAPGEEMEAEAAAQFYQDHEGDRRNAYREFRFPNKNPVRIRDHRDAEAFKGNVATFAHEVASSEVTKKRMEDALLLFSTQHTENRICGPYVGAMAMNIAKIKGFGELTTEPTRADFSFEPVYRSDGTLEKDQFTVTLGAHYATWIDFQRNPERASDATFMEARELLGMGEIIGGNIQAKFRVHVPETGPITISNLKTTYSVQS
jgi:hypothetical protein